MDKKEIMDLVKDLQSKVNAFALMTLDSGYPVARPMSGIIFHNDNTILISTSSNSRKFQHIASSPSATLFMHDGMQYLNIHGTPSMENDPELKSKYWNDAWIEYFPEGTKSEEYTFFRLDINHISYKDFAKDIDIEMDF